jgi:hypothetical protein
MIDIDPTTGAPITSPDKPTPGTTTDPNKQSNTSGASTGVSSNTAIPNINPKLSNQGSTLNPNSLDFIAPPPSDVATDPGKSTTEGSTGNLTGDANANTRTLDATDKRVVTPGMQHSNDLTAGGSVSDNRDNSSIDPASLKGLAREGVLDRVPPMRDGATSADGTMLDFKTKPEPVIAGQHQTERVNIPQDLQKDKAAVLSEIQLVLRDGGMDSMSQIRSLERIAKILHIS